MTGDEAESDTAIIFLPVSVKHEKLVYLHGDVEISNKTMTVYVTGVTQKICDTCLGMYSQKECASLTEGLALSQTWIHLESRDNRLILKKFKMNKSDKNVKTFEVVVIYYDHKIFSQSGNSILTHGEISINDKDHFRSLIARLKPCRESSSYVPAFCKSLLTLLRYIILYLLAFNKKVDCVTKLSNIGVYVDNYLNRLLWLTECEGKDKRENIKRLNFILSLFADALFGVICLYCLIRQFPADFSRHLLSLAETVVQSLRDLIHWLTGDPAGFKLNFMFSKMLATFYLFYIDLWCTFIAYLAAYLRAIRSAFWLFLTIGSVGITFQVTIFADILAVVTFHIHCICLFAAKLYNIQLSVLLSLWRLFLGRKKNPLRNRVDSCKYTPEQLFIGTLAFTILLFLLPTTLIYYVVFTGIRILLSALKGTLKWIRYLVHSLQIYSTILWLIGSPKVCAGIHLIPENPPSKTNCLVFHVKPLCTSWWETVRYDRPDCVEPPKDFKFLPFLYSLLTGTVY